MRSRVPVPIPAPRGVTSFGDFETFSQNFGDVISRRSLKFDGTFRLIPVCRTISDGLGRCVRYDLRSDLTKFEMERWRNFVSPTPGESDGIFRLISSLELISDGLGI